MSARTHERTRGTSSHRQALLSAMSVYLTAPFFSELDSWERRSQPLRWSLQALHFTALLMIYATDEALQDRFKAARRCVIEMFPQRRRPGKTYQGFIKAQNRLGPQAVAALKDHLRGHHRRVAGQFWERWGWVPFACDGSRVEVPRTTRNQALGCAGRKKTGPQLFVTTLYHMGTGLPWDWCIGKGTESERDHLRVMLAKLPPGSLVVADAGFRPPQELRQLGEVRRGRGEVDVLEEPGVARVRLESGEVTKVETGAAPKDVVLARARLFVIHANVSPCAVGPAECPEGESWILVLDPNTLARIGGRDSIPIPGPGNASYASVAADGRIYVLSRGGPESPAGRLTIVDPVSRTEVGSFGGIGEFPGPIAADRGERVMISSPTEGLMEFNSRTRSVVRGAGGGIPVLASQGVTTDSRNQIYGIEPGTCTPGSLGRARVFRPDLSEIRSVVLGVCPRAATTTLIPPAEEQPNR